MNRANFGNVITNGMQILSVGATTSSRLFLGRADSALNNLTEEERTEYFRMKADKMRDEINDYYSYGEEEGVNFENPNLAIKNNEIKTPQGKEIITKINKDYNENKRLNEKYISPEMNIFNKETGRII